MHGEEIPIKLGHISQPSSLSFILPLLQGRKSRFCQVPDFLLLFPIYTATHEEGLSAFFYSLFSLLLVFNIQISFSPLPAH